MADRWFTADDNGLPATDDLRPHDGSIHDPDLDSVDGNGSVTSNGPQPDGGSTVGPCLPQWPRTESEAMFGIGSGAYQGAPEVNTNGHVSIFSPRWHICSPVSACFSNIADG